MAGTAIPATLASATEIGDMWSCCSRFICDCC